MIRCICGVKPHDIVPMETLYTKLGIQFCWDGSSCVEPELRKDYCVLLKDITQ